MALTGETLTAEEALSAGLANRIVPPGEAVAEALRIARNMAVSSPQALAEAKRFLNAQEKANWDHLTSSLTYLFTTAHAREGTERFRTRKAPSTTS